MRHFELTLLGVPFTAYTDSLYLSRFLQLQHPTQRQARWLEQFARFDFKVQHIPGIKNKIADALPRLPTTLSLRPDSPPSSLDEPDLPPIDNAPRNSSSMPASIYAVTRRANSGRSFARFNYLDTARASNARSVLTSSSTAPSAPSSEPSSVDKAPTPTVVDVDPPSPEVEEEVVVPPVDDLLNLAEPSVDPLGPISTTTPVFPTRPSPSTPAPPDRGSPIVDPDLLAEVRAVYPSDAFYRPLVNDPARFPDYEIVDEFIYYELQ
ncbi:hypothetical protein JCM1840_005071 [Sporobolomyces johnsonii]